MRGEIPCGNGNGLVLVVHGDAALRDAIAEALAMDGFHAATGDYANALDVLASLDVGTPGTILLDLHGPAREFKAAFERVYGSGVPIVALTTAPTLLDGSEVDAAALLPQPFDLDDLLALVSRYCAPN